MIPKDFEKEPRETKILKAQLMELGIDFSSQADYPELERIYKEAMHRQWMARAAKGAVIRRRRPHGAAA
jgi:hypothetical protein